MTADQIIEYNNRMFREIFGNRRTIDAPASVLVEDRRKPVNIATVNNHDAECLRRIVAAGQCTCSDQEVEAAP